MKSTVKAAHATIELLSATWPKCFSVAFAGRRPLKIGIGRDIATATEGAITPEELDVAMSLYTTSKRYLKSLKEGAARIDLDGNPVGTVTAEQAAYAARRIEQLEARASARTRARGLAIEEAVRKARVEAEEARRTAGETKRAVEVATGKRKPLLKLPRQAAVQVA